jgi:hypothetical protein
VEEEMWCGVDDKAQINGDGGSSKMQGKLLNLLFFALNSLPVTRGIAGGWGKESRGLKAEKG